MRVEWNSVSTVHGGLSVMTTGTERKLVWSVINWDINVKVCMWCKLSGLPLLRIKEDNFLCLFDSFTIHVSQT